MAAGGALGGLQLRGSSQPRPPKHSSLRQDGPPVLYRNRVVHNL